MTAADSPIGTFDRYGVLRVRDVSRGALNLFHVVISDDRGTGNHTETDAALLARVRRLATRAARVAASPFGPIHGEHGAFARSYPRHASGIIRAGKRVK